MSTNDVETPKEEGVVIDSVPQVEPEYLKGWKLHIMTATLVSQPFPWLVNSLICCSLFSGLFLATLEVSIVSTSLITVTNALHAFGDSSWIVIAYLLTYTGLYAQLILKLCANWREDFSSSGRKSAIFMGENRLSALLSSSL